MGVPKGFKLNECFQGVDTILVSKMCGHLKLILQNKKLRHLEAFWDLGLGVWFLGFRV